MDRGVPGDHGELTLSHRLSAYFFRHPRLRLALLLALPLAWLVVVYLGSLASLLVQSFYSLNDFTGSVERSFTLSTWGDLFDSTTYTIVVRTVAMAAAVTVVAAAIALPIGYVMARVAGARAKALLFLAVLLPLWSSYIVRVYAWQLILSPGGVIEWTADKLALGVLLDTALDLPSVGGPSLDKALLGQFIVFLYTWLPYMILPVAASFERVPESFLEASADLGAKPRTTFRKVTWPLAIPGVVAGSIFTFSLTLGDYIIPGLIGPGRPSIGSAIFVYQGTAGNIPLAAAFTVVPMAIMLVYLWGAKRLGAFEAL